MEKPTQEIDKGDGAHRPMILHGYFQSSAAYRVRIALNMKGLTYENAPHNLRHGEQRDPAYLRLNPQGLVPTLDTGNVMLTQSLAILEWLEETYPEPALLPTAAEDRARVRALAQVCSVDIHPINNLRVLRYLKNDLEIDKERIDRWYRHWIVEGFTALEAMLSSDARTGRFCHGDQPGLADICLAPQMFNAERFQVDLGPFPILVRIRDAANRLPAFAKAAPFEQPDAPRA